MIDEMEGPEHDQGPSSAADARGDPPKSMMTLAVGCAEPAFEKNAFKGLQPDFQTLPTPTAQKFLGQGGSICSSLS